MHALLHSRPFRRNLVVLLIGLLLLLGFAVSDASARYRTTDPTGDHPTRGSAYGAMKAGKSYTSEGVGVDWYYFYVRRTSSVRLQFQNRTLVRAAEDPAFRTDNEDACLTETFCILRAEIYKSGVGQLGHAALVNGGGASGSTVKTLRPGKYYVRVTGIDGAEMDGHAYRVRLTGALSSVNPRNGRR